MACCIACRLSGIVPGSVDGRPSNAVAACAHAAITGSGLPRGDLWALLDWFGLASHLAPARPG